MLMRLLTSTLVLTAASTAIAGGYSGSSGDLHDITTGSAWFLGQAPIRYCIQMDPQFGRSAEDVKTEFESAVKTWKAYLSERQVHHTEPPEHQLDLNFQYNGECQGSEDLRLIMGLETKEVAAAKMKFERPFAFAIRESYNIDTTRGKGFIWLARQASVFPKAGKNGFPNWQQAFTLHGMLLHELGHVLGTSHVEGTIMDENMMPTLQMGEQWPELAKRAEFKLTHIEDTRLLDHEYNTPVERAGILSRFDTDKDNAAVFKIFTGKEPVGKVTAKFETTTDSNQYRLTLRDSAGSQTFDIETDPGSSTGFRLEGNLFQTTYHFQGNATTTSWDSHRGSSSIGTVKTTNGRPLKVQILINAQDLGGPFHLKYYDGKSWQPFFYTKISGT